ncbi:MAG: cell division protein ZapE [Actinomycetota bacterium]
MYESLCDRNPEISTSEILAGLVPPPHFAHSTFQNYVPDSNQPSQALAVQNLQLFADDINRRNRLFSRSRNGSKGRYLDGGFGVGKTHLLAALWYSVDVPKVYGTFVEFTNLVGLLTFNVTVDLLSQTKLLCIDEFELDDPGDTVLMSTLMMRLVENGVYLAATSNTLPDRLGEERFAADDFQREIQGLAAHFETIRIDGQDYRHRGIPKADEPLSTEELEQIASQSLNSSLDDFVSLSTHLATVHQSKYGALINGLDIVCVKNLETISDQANALRWVVLADRLYDCDIRFKVSGIAIDNLFAPELLAGGYRKKYRRALSRLIALNQM